jgi:surface polysaccharide O-acyltransferase-like enzyme
MTRRYDIDALRALAFLLLILYHTGMLYVFDWSWHVKSVHQSEWLQLPMILVNRWRMDLIFMISGIACAFMLKPGESWQFLLSRTWRLILPLVFGMALIVPIQPYAQGVMNGLVQPGFGQFLADYYGGKPWPAGAFDGWEHGVTWNHLWYLAYLWIYTVALAFLAKPLDSGAGRRLRGWLTGLRGAKLMVLPVLPFFAYAVTLQTRFPDNGDFIHDWYRNAVYFTIFLYGYFVARDSGFWAEALRLRGANLACALSLFGVRMILVTMYPEQGPAWLDIVGPALRNLYMWTMLLAIFGWAHALLNKPFRWLPWANESVYPWYVLHQSLIVGIAYWLIPLKLGAVTEPALVLAGTICGCWLLSEGVKRVRWLRPCFGLKLQFRPVARREMARLGDAEA